MFIRRMTYLVRYGHGWKSIVKQMDFFFLVLVIINQYRYMHVINQRLPDNLIQKVIKQQNFNIAHEIKFWKKEISRKLMT